MERLADVPVERLQQALDEVEGTKPTQRLTAAIAYKNGVSQTELAEWYDVQRRTIYSWLTRLEEEPIEQAVYDDHRSGRPRKLDGNQQTQLEEALHEPPTAAGYDASAWTPALVKQYLADHFDVEYSRPSCRRLMKEAGLRYRKPRRSDTGTEDSGRDDGGDSGGRWTPQ